MELTKSELAKFLKIKEEYLHLNNGLWDVYESLDSDSILNKSIIERGDIFVIIREELVKDGKLIVKFGTIDGSFSCGNLELISLEGCPHTVNGFFFCHSNNLTSLQYCPQIINGDFSCTNNNLTSLDYYPKNIHLIVYLFCSNNKITSIPNIKAYRYISHHNNITHISNDIDMTKLCLYKNPYYYFKKFNYGII